ncbi:hypothetical protein VNO80_15451 [Phaseolus coccineus]|uniref:Bacterial surface antigen (D15) domain-containing protein n=1 Tax=Phaseolus coccineus TaxID=3886 RepID=A0AAN9MNR4_PHACN
MLHLLKLIRAKAKQPAYTLSVQMELGTPIPLTVLTYNRFEVFASRGIKLGPTLFFSWMSGETVNGSFASYQAFAISDPSSVRGYGEGAIGVGLSYYLPVRISQSNTSVEVEHVCRSGTRLSLRIVLVG